jgi:hypothetical protein
MQCIFYSLAIISPWRRANPFIWTNLNPLSPRIICAKFGWLKLAQCFWRRSRKCKSLQTDRQTDGWRTKAIRIVHLSFQLRWAKKDLLLLLDYLENLCHNFKKKFELYTKIVKFLHFTVTLGSVSRGWAELNAFYLATSFFTKSAVGMNS